MRTLLPFKYSLRITQLIHTLVFPKEHIESERIRSQIMILLPSRVTICKHSTRQE